MSAVATLTSPVFFDRGEQILFREVRPEFLRDVHFGVGKLPEKKIRQTHLAGSANQQIGIRVIARVEMLAEHLDIDNPLVDVPELDRAKQILDPVDNLEPAPITQG